MFAKPDSTPESESFDTQTIDERTDEELDALAFGVVCLDESGIVLRYNLFESRLARLDRNDVIGKDFFRDVARCTRNPDFEGRFRSFVGGSTDPQVTRFPYLFDFAFGAQDVFVELVRAKKARRYYLLVNRTRVGPPRPSFPRELLAAAQSELSPAEAKRGVRRDEVERRVIHAPFTFLSSLRATLEKLAPETWPLFAGEWGVEWGRRLAIDLEAFALENGKVSIGDLPMRRAGEAVCDRLRSMGLGAPSFDYEHADEGMIVLAVERSALAEAARKSRDGRDDLACHLLAGCVGTILSSLAQRRLAGREVACIAGGAERCTHVIVAHDRRAVVDGVLSAGERGLGPVRAALRLAPSSRTR